MTPGERERATAQMRWLIEQLGNKFGRPERGWKAAVARHLGVHPSYVSRLLSEDDSLQVGERVIEAVADRLGLSREFFVGAPHVRTRADERAVRDATRTARRLGLPAGAEGMAGDATDAEELVMLRTGEFVSIAEFESETGKERVAKAATELLDAVEELSLIRAFSRANRARIAYEASIGTPDEEPCRQTLIVQTALLAVVLSTG